MPKTKATRDELRDEWASAKAERDVAIETAWERFRSGEIDADERQELEAAAKAEWTDVKTDLIKLTAELEEGD